MPIASRPVDHSSHHRIARLALVVPFGTDTRHWFVAPLLDGLEESAAEQGLSIELLFSQRIDVRTTSQRLMQHRPDMVAGVLAVPRIELVLSEAQRQGIPCVIAADRFDEMEQPNVYEDSVQGAALAVRHLVAQGHKRIGFIQIATRAWWVFDRRQGYLNGLAEAGLEADERMTLWLPPFDFAPGSPMIHTDAIQQYLDRQQPTAIVCGCCSPLMQMSRLISSGKLSVPQDLSVVTFDNCPQIVEWLGGVRPTIIAQPMREIGRCLARMARQVVDGKPLELRTVLSCDLIEGDSVRDIRPQAVKA
jgi:DNA-binding LacI/PurR family transcriptional regulator